MKLRGDCSQSLHQSGNYELYPKYEDVFAKKTGLSKEIIFAIPRSKDMALLLGIMVSQLCTRTPEDLWFAASSWNYLLRIYVQIGLPMTNSLFDPHNPI